LVQVQIGGKQCYVNFSRSQAINRSAAQRVGITTTTAGVPVRTQSLQHRGENVLLCTINNAIYHVTVRSGGVALGVWHGSKLTISCCLAA